MDINIHTSKWFGCLCTVTLSLALLLSLSRSGTVSFAALNTPHLQYLGLRSLKEISDGDVVIKNNPNLCYVDGSYWQKLFKSEKQRIKTINNSHTDSCGETQSSVV